MSNKLEKQVKELIAQLEDEVDAVRAWAAYALGEIKDHSAVPALIIALGDDDANTRESAAYALGEIADSSAVPALIIALGDEVGAVRGSAAWALGIIAGNNPMHDLSDVVPALIVAVKDRSVLISEKAAWALGKIGDATATPALVVALKDDCSVVRNRAAEALGKIKDPSAISALTGALKDEHAGVRWSAILALGRIGKPEVIEPLAKLLFEEKDRGPLQQIISSLVKIGTPAAVAHVIKYMDTCPENVIRLLVDELHNKAYSDRRNMKLLHLAVRKMKRKNYCSLSAEEKQDMLLKLEKTYLMWSGNLCEVAKQRVIIYKERAMRNPKMNLDKPKPPVNRIHRVRRMQA